MTMVTAVESRPGTNPDRASFTTALEAARDQLTAATGIIPNDPTDLGMIGHAVLDTLLPDRRARYSARKVKGATSRYLARDDRPQAATAIADIAITLHLPSLTPPPAPRPPRTPPAPTRRQRITAIMNTEPHRPWTGRELADRLGVKPRNMLTQLAEWTRLGFLTRTGDGTYALPEPP